MARKIELYRFGQIVVDGIRYTSDLKILGEKVIPNWWRKEGHLLVAEDIKDLLEAAPDVLVVGRGAYSAMKIAPDLERLLAAREIALVAGPTSKAVAEYNALAASGEKRVCAAFHLTC